MMSRREWMVAVGFGVVCGGEADAQGFLERLGLKRSSVAALSEERVREGLREALTVGIDRTVKRVGKVDGYFLSKKLKIPLPKSLKRIERPLRAAGYGSQVDEFVLSMNRAAEKSAPLAQAIFVDAISEMSVADARGILKGKDTAATEYLDRHTREDLMKVFTPKVRAAMDEYAVTAKYQALASRYASLPFARKYLDGNVEGYTTGKALDGLFLVLGEEEKRIRTKPVARTTDLLRKVFGE